MRTLPLAEVKNRFSAVVEEINKTHEAVTVTRNGESVVVVLAGDDYESLMETLALAFDDEGRTRLIEAEQSIAEGDVTTGDEMAELMRQRVERERRGGE